MIDAQEAAAAAKVSSSHVQTVPTILYVDATLLLESGVKASQVIMDAVRREVASHIFKVNDSKLEVLAVYQDSTHQQQDKQSGIRRQRSTWAACSEQIAESMQRAGASLRVLCILTCLEPGSFMFTRHVCY